MTRRQPYTKIIRDNFARPAHVRGMSDVPFKGFACLNPNCQEWVFVRKDEIAEEFEIPCPACGSLLQSGRSTELYDYQVKDLRSSSVLKRGKASILHDDYLEEALDFKYCVICSSMKSADLFDRHRSRKRSQRQGECRLCKRIYNALKNPTRLSDQHREAAQKRRLYIDLTGGQRLNVKTVLERFEYRCFKCGADLRNVASQCDRPLDHTLPAQYLWPLTTENATLLCRKHNGQKSGKWPSQYYSKQEMKRLSVLTGVSYQLLSGKPHFNPEVLTALQNAQAVDEMLAKNAAYMEEIIHLRNRVLRAEGIDLFAAATAISPAWVTRANKV
jgi:hypothetical protein